MICIWRPAALAAPVDLQSQIEWCTDPEPADTCQVALVPASSPWRVWRRTWPQLSVLVQATGAPAAVALAHGADDVVSEGAPAQVVLHRLRRLSAAAEAQRSIHDQQATDWETRDVLTQLLRILPDPVIGSDLHGRIFVFSEGATRLFGFSGDEVKRRYHVSDLYADPTEARRIMTGLRASEGDERYETTTKVRTRSGDVIPVHIHAALLRRSDGVVIASLGILRDQRDHQQLERRLARSAQDLLAAEERARIQQRHKILDELSQPLTSAMGWMEILAESEDIGEGNRERVERVSVQLQRIATMIATWARGADAPTKPWSGA